MQLLADYQLVASVHPDDNVKLAICSQNGQDNLCKAEGPKWNKPKRT